MKLITKLVHWWRLATEPQSGLFGGSMPQRWYVQYDSGARSVRMSYRTACNYAEMFGGVVKRAQDRKPITRCGND